MVALAVSLAGLIAITFLTLMNLDGLSTRAEPSRVERTVARLARRVAVPRQARDARNPVAFSQEGWTDARAHFADHCAICHANDGSGRTEIGQNLYPKAPDMRLAETQDLSDGELYWIIENGVRLTGMPAWGTGGDNDADTWKLVHFVRRLKDLTAEQLEEMEALNPKSPAEIHEEHAEDQFLSGADVDTEPAGGSHHHGSKENP